MKGFFSFHNDNNDEYHRRDLRIYFPEDQHGTNDDLCEEQEGCGRFGGLVYDVRLHRSSFEFY